MRVWVLWAISALALLSGCRTPQHTAEDAAPPVPYVRILNTDSNLVQLQVALREFVPDRHHRQPALWLMGVSHIGQSNYYARLQKELDAKTLVLFEGVGDHPDSQTEPAEPAVQTNGPAQGEADESRSSLQSAMAAALGLVFQLQAIDYQRTNLQHCDLSVEQIRNLLAEHPPQPGQEGAGPSFESLLQLMQGGSLFDSLLRLGLQFIGSNQKFQGLARLALLETINEIQGDPSNLAALPPDAKELLNVLLQKRNDQVLACLQTDLKKLRRADSLAVFYGTGHMPDLERKIRSQLHYRPAGELWLTAFSVDLRRAGISPAEEAFIRHLIQTDLAPLKSTGPAAH